MAAQPLEGNRDRLSDTADQGAVSVQERFYPVVVGDPLAQIGGGPLEEPLTMPLWIEIEAGDDDKCGVFTDLMILPLEGNRIYLDQQNPNCRLDYSPSCRVLDLRTLALNQPSSCLHELGGYSYRADPLGEDWFVVYTYIEGPTMAALVQWSPERPMEVHLEHISESESGIPVTRHDDEFLIQSICDPLTGSGGGYDALMNRTAPVRYWRWNPGFAPEEITVEVPQDDSP